jgi:hypothetical protein
MMNAAIRPFIEGPKKGVVAASHDQSMKFLWPSSSHVVRDRLASVGRMAFGGITSSSLAVPDRPTSAGKLDFDERCRRHRLVLLSATGRLAQAS